ncbi:hypothetical protein [Chachezhania antarctica]|uniref:hypothetical protein n=1 Tax=Chachezhania antarctica TaxID=2340860 RepID=UPI000EB37712|nr:hypothetical protein [Chachezhania antarctica]|tara:strand:- start:2531 stop:3331 length:801 start_codon:yes stop_codon:yes gene_type:complete
MSEPRRPGILIILAFAAVAFLAMVSYRANPLNEGAKSYATAVAATSAGVYVTLRSINAFLSTAQEIEVSGGAVFVSGSAQPLKVLEPIDDTIERISAMVFGLMVATGVVAVGIGPISAVGFGMIVLSLGIDLIRRVIGKVSDVTALERQLLRYGLLFGLGVPLAFVLTSQMADWMTADVWAEYDAVVQDITAEVDLAEAGESASVVSNLRSAINGVERYQTLAANLLDRADDLLNAYVMILSVFIFKLLLLPALILGGLIAFSRRF